MKKDTARTAGSRTPAHVRWLLVFYDFLIYAGVIFLLLGLHPSIDDPLAGTEILVHGLLGAVCIFAARFLGRVYGQIWRYGGARAYIRLLLTDVAGGIVYIFAELLLPITHVSFVQRLSIVCMNLLGALAARLLYYFAYQYASRDPNENNLVRQLLLLLGGVHVNPEDPDAPNYASRRIKVAIIGAGRVGAALAEELLENPQASYAPVCFVDVSREKTGRSILSLPVFDESTLDAHALTDLGVQEIIFAVPQITQEAKKALYERYKAMGMKIKVYDYPTVKSASGRRHLREFEIEELLFRPPIEINSDGTAAYYTGKTVLITGGGGSIGSEICRQIARMAPKRIVILDVYENGAYEIEQELKAAHPGLPVQVEILSVCDRVELEKVFATYRPEIVLNAAAHKHVPLMEHNCCEAVHNNVFGTLNTVQMAEKYEVERFIMVSTDKAVNPTNVMGATKRMCEMIVQSYSTHSKVAYSSTRFGNVLGSAGSVIPLFKRQIANGGPVTLTDKRIIRYFMTISEATQLVLQAGAMSNSGTLYVLDMGKPVKILDLAENMIRLSGYEPYRDIDIIETGLRPGEKLYEELLIESETLTKTENSLIFIERDTPLSPEVLETKLNILKAAADSGDDNAARLALMAVIPTYHDPGEVNENAVESREMKMAAAGAGV